MQNFKIENEMGRYKRIKSLKEYKEWRKYEDHIYSDRGIRYRILYFLQASERVILHKHMKLLRKTEYHTNCGHKIRAAIYQYRLNKLQNKYAIHIPINTCGKGLRLMHLGPILLNKEVRLGEDCTLHINTALVSGNKFCGAPKGGDRVTVFTGASVIGGVTIADGIKIGANSVVTKSFFEENSILAGVPAKNISCRS